MVYSFLRLYICACCDKQYTELDTQGLNYVCVFNYVCVVRINAEYYLRNMDHL
jgi:hypothetical protein